MPCGIKNAVQRSRKFVIVIFSSARTKIHDAPITHTISSMQQHHAMVHLERLENMVADLLGRVSEQRVVERTRAEVAAQSWPGPGYSHPQRIIQTMPPFSLRTPWLAT